MRIAPLAAVVLTACTSASSGGSSSSASAASSARQSDALAVWSTTGARPSSACLAGDTLLVVEDKTVSRLDAGTGATLWKAPPGKTEVFVDETCTSVSTLDVTPTEAVVSEISLADGKVSGRSSVTLAGPRSYGWYRHGDKLYGMHYRHVTQIDLTKAAVDWTTEVTSPQLDWIGGPRFLSDRLVVRCGEDLLKTPNGLCTLALRDGLLVAETGRQIVDFVIEGGDLFVLEATKLVKETRAAGAPTSTVWSVPAMAETTFASVSVDDGKILAVSGTKQVSVHSIADGRELLRVDELELLPASEVTLAGDWLVFPSFAGDQHGLVAWRTTTGERLRLVPLSSKFVVTTEFVGAFPEHVAFRPVASRGRVLAQSHDGPLQLFALP